MAAVVWTPRMTAPRVYAIALSLVAAVALTVCDADLYGCPQCGSTRRTAQIRIGICESNSVPLTPTSETLNITDASRDLFGPNHVHVWRFRGRDGGRFLLSGSCCVDPRISRPNPFVRTWEENPFFRRFVDAQRAAGRLAAEEVASLAILPGFFRWSQAGDSSLATRLARAQALFASCGILDRDGDWARWTIPQPSPGCPGPKRR